MTRMANIINGLTKIGLEISVISVFALIVSVFIGVVVRAVGISFPGPSEVAGFFQAALVFFGFAYTVMMGRHVSVRLITDRLPPQVRAYSLLITVIISLVWVAFLLIGCCLAWWHFYSNRVLLPGILTITLWIPGISMVLGTFILLLQCFVEVGRRIKVIRSGGEESAREDSEEGVTA